MFLWTAFTIGLFGSLHCVGMCGPIACALPGSAGASRSALVGNALRYNLGRTLTYSLLGAVIGLAGRGLQLAGFQQFMSIALGVLLLAIALFSINVEANLLRLPGLNQLVFRLKSHLARLLKDSGVNASFFIGLLNGLLPCGLVYMAVVGALSTGGIGSGMAYMALFGLGTFPMMLATGLAGNFAGIRFRTVLRKAYPAFLVFFAVLFIFRGLNFHVPGDFFFWAKLGDTPMCH
ncbi:MAG: sulfite exporter TauE/SafE family protein [Saprospiraceae bacterium]|nr:sulfite exporter TauE/SafE family protein [Saprospiraceae bacterium]